MQRNVKKIAIPLCTCLLTFPQVSERMENPEFIKCEPGFLSDAEEDTKFEAKVEEIPSENLLDIKNEPISVFPDAAIKEEISESEKGDILRKLLTKNQWTAVSSVAFPQNNAKVPVSKADDSYMMKRNHDSRSQEYSIRNVLGPKVRPWICNICGETSRTEWLLKRHISVHGYARGTQNDTTSCSICCKTFTTRNYLKIHMRLHTGQEFRCSLCWKRYTRQSYLKSHMTLHTD